MKLLEPVNLTGRIGWGMNTLLGGLDPTERHIPYWNCGFANGGPTGFKHTGAWDRCHDVARAIHGLTMAEEATSRKLPSNVMEDLTSHLFALFDAGDGLPGTMDDAGRRFVNLHNVREVTHALTALIRRGDRRAELLARRMARTLRDAFDDEGRIHLERLPAYVERYTFQPAQEGRAVDALVRYYRVAQDPVALELAVLMTRYALEHCFTPSGSLTEEAGTHGHSITAIVAGMLDLAVLMNDGALLSRAKAVYDVGLPRFNSSFGWSMESLSNYTPRGEANNTGDLLRASLLLGQAGFPEYFNRAERILRSHLLPSQVMDVEGFSDDPNAGEDHLRSLASRIRGGFSFPTPNDLLVAPDAPIVTYDITSGAVDALCEARKGTITKGPSSIRVDLLLDGEAEGVRVKSHLSGEGLVKIENTSGRSLSVRIPSWVKPADARLEIDGAEHPFSSLGAYILMEGAEAENLTVRFPMLETRTKESICYRWYTIDWRGDQIVAMSPRGEHLPIFPPCV